MSGWFDRALKYEGISSIPSYINLEKDKQAIKHFLGDKKLKEYAKRYTENRIDDTLSIFSPVDLLIAGHFIRVVRKHQSAEVLSQVKKKIASANINDNQIFDTIAELNIIGCASAHYTLCLDKETSVPGRSKSKDSDIFIIDEDVHMEVKNFNLWYVQSTQRMIKLGEKYSTPHKQLQINPQAKNKDNIVVFGTKYGVQSIADATPRNYAPILKTMLKEAVKKFNGNQKSVLVMTNVINPGTANRVVRDWYFAQNPSVINYVVVSGPRKSTTGKRDVHVIELVHDANARRVVETVFSGADVIVLKGLKL